MVEYSEDDGGSMEKAVIIKAANSFEGLQAEYQYLSNKFGVRGTDWNLAMQSLLHQDEKNYDLMKISLKDGRNVDMYFDITDFFGKPVPSYPKRPG